MIKTIPKSQLIIGWRDVFGKQYEGNRIVLISHGCKRVILGELAGLNYRLKSNKTNYSDISLATQRKELAYFAGGNPKIFQAYGNLVGRFLADEKSYGLLFTRAACLFAIEEIIQSDMVIREEFTMKDFWPDLFKYLLAVNQEITRLTESRDDEVDIENDDEQIKESAASMEDLNPKLIALNEVAVNTNSLYTGIRGFYLLEYLVEHPQLGNYLKQYLADSYQFEYDQFVFELIRLYFANNKNGENDIVNEFTKEKLDTSFYYVIKDKNILPFSQKLSGIYPSPQIERLISVKKYPLYAVGNQTFLLLDNILVLEKCYYQLINDFWFDVVSKVKDIYDKPVFTIKYYRSAIGYFLEKYTDKIIRYCFSSAKFYEVKLFDELLLQNQNNVIELADVYVRYNKKIFLAQVKSTGIYDNEKYAGDTEGLYKNGRDDFYKSFGLNQIVESIRNIELIAGKIDTKFPTGHSYRIYPALIVNEKALQTPVMAYLFNERFQELIAPYRKNKVHIYPLSVIHISDLEQMEETLHKIPDKFWDILSYNVREPKFIPPFYNTAARLEIVPDYSNALELFSRLIEKFSPKDHQVQKSNSIDEKVDEISGVFKYRSYEWAKEMIQSRQLWFSKPTAFKDSFDCSPEILVKHFDFIYSETSDPLFKEELAELAEMYRGNKTVRQWLDNPEKVAEIYSVIQAPKIATASVLCLCFYPHSKEMWMEYGDHGKGVCLGFNLDTNPFFDDVDNDSITQGPVTYGWPDRKINFFDSKIDSLKAIFLTKAKGFSHEEEFRMILLNEDGPHRFNKKALATITFGVQVSDDEIFAFRQLCIDNGFAELKYYKIRAEGDNLLINLMVFHANKSK